MINALKSIFNIIDGFRSYDLFDRPVFIISAPRSGSTLLYELMLKFDNVYGFSVEADHVWRTIFPRARLADESDLVSLDDYSLKKEKEFKRYLYRSLMWDLEKRRKVNLIEKIGLKKIRYIEKTIANCFHLDFIEKIFPDCYYIWLIRDPRAVLSSMLVGWRGSKRAAIYKYINPLKDQFNLELFPYPLPPNWPQNMRGKVEAEAFVWALLQYFEYPKNFFEQIESSRKILIRYEEVIDNPKKIIKTISSKFGLILNKNFEKSMNFLPLSRTTVTKPQPDKWKKLHGHIMDYYLVKSVIINLLQIFGYN